MCIQIAISADFGRFHDLIVDAYGDPGEDYPLSMETRLDRMPRIAVRDVVEKIDRWNARYRPAIAGR